MKYAFRSTCLAAAFVALGVQAAQAQAQTYLTQTQASITNFSYSLVDLDLDDGVASSIVFQGPSNYGLSVAVEGSADMEPNLDGPSPPFNPFDSSNSFSISSSNGSGTFAVNGTNMTSTAQIRASDAAQVLGTPVNAAPAGYMIQSGATNWAEPTSYFSDDDFANRSGFVLAPHTRLVIEGNLVLQSLINSEVLDPALLSSITGAGASVMAESYAYARFYIQVQSGSLDSGDLQSQKILVHDAQNTDVSGYSDVDGPTTFKLEVYNDTDDYQKGIFNYLLATSSTVLLREAVPQVPEPGTLALHTLGLMGIAAAVVRQRRSKAQA